MVKPEKIMEKPSRIAANLAAAAVVASLFGMSAFAESRHRDETNRSGRTEQSEGRIRREARPDAPAGQASRFDRRSQQSTESDSRNNTSRPSQTYDRPAERQRQTADRSRPAEADSRQGGRPYDINSQRDRSNGESSQRQARGGYESQNGYNRGNDRGYDNRSNGNYGRSRGADSRHSITMQGRVTRVMHERNGYRVWLDRGGYSYWVPEARFRLWPLRVGVSIRLGGWWDPMGYVNVYDMGPMGGPYYTSGDLRGIVETVDYRRGTAVVRDDLSGSFVTILLRGNDPRLGSLRPGDYVDLSGAWSRNGYFEAYNVLVADGGRGGYGNGY